MQSVTVTDVSASEWRWVIIFSGLLVALTLLPLAWAFASDSPNAQWQFMGMLHNHLDGATYLSKIGEGTRGSWLFTLNYTPEAQNGVALNEFYLFLGQAARVLSLTPLLMFHVARLVTGFIMYISIYHLGSTIWQRLRPRRLFFGFIAFGSGLGWLYVIFAPRAGALPTDLVIPESIPFYSTLVNPHFPLTIALIALLAATFVVVFRPGFNLKPTLANGGGTVFLLTLVLCIVQPQGWVGIAAAVSTYIVLLTAMRFFDSRRHPPAENGAALVPISVFQRFWKSIPEMELSWTLLLILPAVPILLYYLVVINQNPAMKIWNEQNSTPSPSPDKFILGFGLMLIIALPGIWRAIRHFERDGDQFMLVWTIVNVALLYAPFNLQRRLSIGLIIPIVYFVVRSLEDFWFYRIGQRWRDAAMLAVFVFIMPSNILVLGLPLFGVARPAAGIDQDLLLPAASWQAIRWLNANAVPGTVVLAKAESSLWIPAYTALHVVYGHPFETLNAPNKLQQVAAWYDGTDCQQVIDDYQVRYILIEPTINPLVSATDTAPTPVGNPVVPKVPGSGAACLKTLGLTQPAVTFGDTAIYEVR